MLLLELLPQHLQHFESGPSVAFVVVAAAVGLSAASAQPASDLQVQQGYFASLQNLLERPMSGLDQEVVESEPAAEAVALAGLPDQKEGVRLHGYDAALVAVVGIAVIGTVAIAAVEAVD